MDRVRQHSTTPTLTPTPTRRSRLHPYVRHARFPRENVGEDVGVGVVECGLKCFRRSSRRSTILAVRPTRPRRSPTSVKRCWHHAQVPAITWPKSSSSSPTESRATSKLQRFMVHSCVRWDEMGWAVLVTQCISIDSLITPAQPIPPYPSFCN